MYANFRNFVTGELRMDMQRKFDARRLQPEVTKECCSNDIKVTRHGPVLSLLDEFNKLSAACIINSLAD